MIKKYLSVFSIAQGDVNDIKFTVIATIETSTFRFKRLESHDFYFIFFTQTD